MNKKVFIFFVLGFGFINSMHGCMGSTGDVALTVPGDDVSAVVHDTCCHRDLISQCSILQDQMRDLSIDRKHVTDVMLLNERLTKLIGMEQDVKSIILQMQQRGQGKYLGGMLTSFLAAVACSPQVHLFSQLCETAACQANLELAFWLGSVSAAAFCAMGAVDSFQKKELRLTINDLLVQINRQKGLIESRLQTQIQVDETTA